MQTADTKDQQFGFVQQLARDLAADDICLPSFPAVVLKIRALLEDSDSELSQVCKAVSTDPALVSKLFVFANSSYHNRSGESVASLENAIARVGFKLVRSTALSLAVKQLMFAKKHQSIVGDVRGIWTSSMRLASMCYAIASLSGGVDEESAFLCGLLHQIGKLYILTKAIEFPDFLGDPKSLKEVQSDWHSQVGKAIVDAWDFPVDVVQSMDPEEFFDEYTHLDPAPVDIVYAANSLLTVDPADWPTRFNLPVWRKLGLDESDVENLTESYTRKLEVVQSSLS